MSSVTQQKSELRDKIHDIISRELDTDPSMAMVIAIGAIAKLSAKMTLKELKAWHDHIAKHRKESIRDDFSEHIHSTPE